MPRLFDGQVEVQKPPLYYWLVAALAWCHGGQVSSWDVRLPAAGAGLGAVFWLYFLGRWRGRVVAGLLAALILATTQHFTWSARTGRIDMPLTLAVSVSLGCFFLGQCCRRHSLGGCAWKWFLLAYLGAAGALLLKGPIGVVLPGAVAGAHLLLEGDLPPPWRLRRWLGLIHDLGIWWGLPLIILLAGPCFWWAEIQTQGAFGREFFQYHNVERFWGRVGGHWHPWWYYGPRLGMDLLPWSLLLAPAGWWMVRRNGWRIDPEARFGLTWLIVVVLVLSCAGFKRGDYLLPAYPGAALVFGCAGERLFRRREYATCVAGGLVAAACAAGWLIYVDAVLPGQEAERESVTFAREIRRLARPPHPNPPPPVGGGQGEGGAPVVFFRVEAHALAFQVGSPLETLVEWTDLKARVSEASPLYVVMRQDTALEWKEFLPPSCLEEVARNTELAGGKHEKPLIPFRSRENHSP